MKLYKWQREYIESDARANLLCCGNQQGKSSANIIKMIRLATEPSLWPKFFPNRRPHQFWFLMPTKDLVTTEFRTKWLTEFLPRGEYKDHPQYGWKEEIRNRHVWAVHFNTGVSIYMHTYEQDVHHLQAGTVDGLFVDEEPPWELMPELLMRIAATNGIFCAVMTPTRGQEQWRKVFEVRGGGEIFPDAYKRQISVYECLEYEDGTPSKIWSHQRVNQMRNQLGTQQEIDLRIYGRFVAQEGLKVPAFRRDANIKPPSPVPKHWLWYSGVDVGSGGFAHKPAICFVAVQPDYKFGRVVLSWMPSDNKIYTATDVLDKYLELRDGRNMIGEFYDWASADFGTVAQRSGLNFQKAEKSHEIGWPMLNTLYKNEMLQVDDTPDNQRMVTQMLNLRHGVKKQHADDDLIDAKRYCITKIPWNFDGIANDRVIATARKEPTEQDKRRGLDQTGEIDINAWSVDDEYEEFNDLIDPNW